MNQKDPTDTHRTFHPNTKEYPFSTPQVISTFEHILTHKASLNRHKKIKIGPVSYEIKKY